MCLKCFEKLSKIQYFNKDFINWFEDETCCIAFSKVPSIVSKQIHNRVMTKDEIKKAKQKPLLLINDVEIVLENKVKNNLFHFSIPSGYDYDGATICKIFWKIIGTKEDIRFKIPSLVHDMLCENPHCVGFDRQFSSIVFERLLQVSDTNFLCRKVMFLAVELFQIATKKWKWQ